MAILWPFKMVIVSCHITHLIPGPGRCVQFFMIFGAFVRNVLSRAINSAKREEENGLLSE
jgi:hypothetical protein